MLLFLLPEPKTTIHPARKSIFIFAATKLTLHFHHQRMARQHNHHHKRQHARGYLHRQQHPQRQLPFQHNAQRITDPSVGNER